MMLRMSQKQSLLDPIMLAARWRLLASMFVALTRHLTHRERAGARKIWETLETLELHVRVSLVTLNKQISELLREPMPDEASEDALKHLRAMAAMLLALSIFLQAVKARMTLAGWSETEARPLLRDACGSKHGYRCAAALQAVLLPGGYFNSS